LCIATVLIKSITVKAIFASRWKKYGEIMERQDKAGKSGRKPLK
jgi:hypothetical protein